MGFMNGSPLFVYFYIYIACQIIEIIRMLQIMRKLSKVKVDTFIQKYLSYDESRGASYINCMVLYTYTTYYLVPIIGPQ